MAFSGTVRIADLSDFIAPSQSCVVSLSGNRLNPDTLAEVLAREPQQMKGSGQVEQTRAAVTGRTMCQVSTRTSTGLVPSRAHGRIVGLKGCVSAGGRGHV